MRQFQMSLTVALWQHGRQWLAASRNSFTSCFAAEAAVDAVLGCRRFPSASCAELEVPKAKHLNGN